MGKILAIKGHPTRGKEVIKILEMLGGHNKYHINDTECNLLYTIREGDDVIIGTYPNSGISQVYTLEQFLEKYPFKVGDKVKYKPVTSSGPIFVIEKMKWEDNQIKYIIRNTWCNARNRTVTAKDLQHYKEELRQERKYPELRMDLDDDDKLATEVVIGGDKILPPNGYLIGKITQVDNGMLIEFVKKQPQYPKTYEECCQITKKVAKTTHELDIAYNPNLIYDFQKLLICRDAYWKIAGEELGLSEPWKPNFGENFIYAISAFYGTIQKTMVTGGRGILLFPTEEMRDAFYENFKFLIDKCKELL